MAEPQVEFLVTFHVTSASKDDAQAWQKTVLGLLDAHQAELVNRRTDVGAFCSGHVADMPRIPQTLLSNPCPSCNDGCKAAVWCNGCDMVICIGCNAEHNQDAPCHVTECCVG